MNPIYSICMCNYNMADTLERSLTTILEQIDERFEVLVVDDGSSDNSLEVLHELQKKYPKFLRIHPLPRDRKRKLGLTRNVSVQEARGEYVMLHLDCDDIFEPYLIDFTIVFHQIEKCLSRDILLSGKHINMGKRSFLLSYGPYRNIFRGEDRDLWRRLAAANAYIPFEHVNFVKRLPKTVKKRSLRSLGHVWDHIVTEFRGGMSLTQFFHYERKKQKDFSLKLKFYRLLIIIPAYMAAKFQEPLLPPPEINTFEKLLMYREKMRGNFTEIMERNNCVPDFSGLRSAEAQNIFKG